MFKISWKRRYRNENGLIPQTVFPIANVKPGKHSYGELNIVSFNQNSKLYIGNYVSIAQNVTFLLDADHYTNHISTYPFKAKLLSGHEKEAVSKGDIIIEDDVWIGYGSTIMSGVRIGQGAIIGAGAIVTKDIPAYAIAGGIPARLLKYRFDDKTIRRMKELDFGRLDISTIARHVDVLYTTVDDETDLSWFPKKKHTGSGNK